MQLLERDPIRNKIHAQFLNLTPLTDSIINFNSRNKMQMAEKNDVGVNQNSQVNNLQRSDSMPPVDDTSYFEVQHALDEIEHAKSRADENEN